MTREAFFAKSRWALRLCFVAVLTLMAMIAMGQVQSFSVTVESFNPNSGVQITNAPADNNGVTNGTTTYTLTYNDRTAVTLTAPASEGNSPFLFWNLNGTNQTAGQTSLQFAVTGNTTAIAVYAIVATIGSENPSSGVPITNAPADSNGVTGGTTQYTLDYSGATALSLTAPATFKGNIFKFWTLNGVEQGAGATTVRTKLTANLTAIAVYSIPNFALAVQSQNPNSGVVVTASPADNAGLTRGTTSFTLNYPNGTPVTLTAPAKEGNNPFLNWTVNGVAQTAGQTAVTTTISAATTAVAVYQPTNVLTVQSQDPTSGVKITNSPADNNGVSGGTTQYALVYNTGTSVTLTAPATSGFNIFKDWTIGGVAQTAGQLSVTTTLNADTTAVAVYTTPNFALTVQSQNPNSGVAVTASPADNAGLTGGTTSFTLNYAAGASVTLTAPAKEGNNPFLHWTINGVAQTAGQTAVTTTISAATTAIAVYQPTNVLTVQSQDPASGVKITNSPADNNGVSGGTTQYALVYNTGTSVTLTAPATSGFNIFKDWTIGGVAQTAGQLSVTTTLNADTTAVAVYTTPNFALTVQSQNPNSGVAVTASPADNAGLTGGTTSFTLNYAAGASVTLTAPAKEGNNPFLHWTINGAAQTAGQTAVTTTISAATTAIAVYQPTNVLTVQSQDPASGVKITNSPADNNGVSGGTTQYTLVYNTGTSVTVTAPATSGLSVFKNWTIGGVAQTAGQLSVTTTLNGNTTVVAVYTTPNFALTVQSQNPASGVTVKASPADNAGLTGGTTSFTLNYAAGASVTLTAPTTSGLSVFKNWTIGGVAQTAGQLTVTTTLNGNTTAVAVYVTPNFALTVQSQNPASGVAVTASPADNAGLTGGTTSFTLNYAAGTSVTLTAPEKEGNNPFLHWTINGVAQTAGQTAVTTTITAATTAVAVYQPTNVLTVQSQDPTSGVTITNSPADNNGVSGGTTQYTLVYNTGTSVTVTAPATSGLSVFKNWTIGGVAQTAGQLSVTTTLNGNTTVVAVYTTPNFALTVQSQNPASGVTVKASPADNAGLTGGTTSFTLNYAAGASVTLTAPTTSGLSVFKNWTIGGVAQTAGQLTVTTTLNGNTTAVAVYVTPNFALTVQSQNPASGVAVTASPADNAGLTGGTTSFTLNYAAGTSVTLTAPEKEGNNPFLHWTINGVAQTAGQTAVTTTITAATTAVAVYQPTNVLTVQSQDPTSGVTITNSPADNNGVSGGTTQYTLVYNTGTSVTVTAPATSGLSVFKNWTIGGVAQTAGQLSVTTTLNGNTTVVAVYTTPNFALTVQSQNPASGVTVKASPADNAGLTGGTTSFTLNYAAGTSVTLTAPATEGNNPFLRWTINGVNQPAGQVSVTVSVTGATTAVAVYQATNVLTVQSQDPASGVTIADSPADNTGAKSGATQFALIYNTGTSVTLTAPAASGLSVFKNWTINGVAQPAGQLGVTTVLNANTTAIAVYTTPNFALTVQSQNPASGVTVAATPADNAGLTSGSTSFNLSYPAGNRVTLTAPAKSGNNPFIRWIVNGINQPAEQLAVTVPVTGATTAIAVYQPTNVLMIGSQNPNAGVKVSNAPADNSGISSGTTQYSVIYDTGASVTLTAPTTVGMNTFLNWTVNGVVQSGTNPSIKITLNADTTAVATYMTPNYGLSVQSQNPNSGVNITASPADNSGLTGGATTFKFSYPNLTRVTLTAPAKVGNNPFLHWTVDGVTQPAGNLSAVVAITNANTAIAIYQPTNVLTVQSQNPNSGVTVTAAPADNSNTSSGTTQFALIYDTGTKVTLTAPALQGKNTFGNWIINGVAQPAGQIQIQVTVNADTTVVASYNTPIYTITTSVLGTHGTVSPTPTAMVLLGGSQTFTATPAAGYAVNTWVLDGVVAQTGGDTFQLTNLQANHTLQVTISVVLVYHPADTNQDGKLEINEITAYGAAWKRGESWPTGPNPIPQSFVTNAISLWKSGEAYTYNPALPEPNAWIPLASAPFGTQSLAPASLGSASATESGVKQLDGSYVMTIQVNPSNNTKAMTVEEHLAANVQVVSVGDRGIYDSKRQIIRWGPFTDGVRHSVTYQARFKGVVSPSGVASFDGINVAVKRDRSAGGK